MKILSAQQIREVDAYTITHEPIASVDLMERAAMACFKRLLKFSGEETTFYIVSGKGNNGGDGLAIARLLFERGFDVQIAVINYTEKFSGDAQANYELIKSKFPARLHGVNNLAELKTIFTNSNALVVDALFGSGLNKAVEGLAGEVIQFINKNFRNIVSIDVPSGLKIDECSSENQNIVHSSLTLSLQLPKLAFLMAENYRYVPAFEIIDIGLHAEGISQQKTNHFYVSKELICSLIKPRNKFDHKGKFGHALLVAGSDEMPGAALISAKACLRSGAGLLSVHSTQKVTSALPDFLPEAMIASTQAEHISELPNPERYDAIAFGPGVGKHKETEQALKKLLQYYKGRIVIDADGLNLLAENKTLLDFLPPSTILTPHPKEFEKLTEKADNDFHRLSLLKKFSFRHNCIVILKGAYSAIAMPDGNVFFNSTGNPGLAKGGSGDALAGIILGLLARGYNAPQSALIATYVHGLAADLCAKKMSMESMLISDVIEKLPKAFQKLEK